MPVIVPRGPGLTDDEGLRAIATELERLLADRPGSTVELYRRGKYMVRARVTDPQFAGLTDGQRHQIVWDYLSGLPDEVAGDLTFLVPITPGERDSGASREFDDPTPVSGTLRLFAVGKVPDPQPAP